MKRAFIGAILLSALSPAGAVGQTLDQVIGRLSATPGQTADVSYEVLLPSSANPVTYDIKLSYSIAPGDTLAPSDYLIDWTLPRGQKTSHGFNAYFDGNHFRYRDTKLQEYHWSDDPNPFLTSNGGVQRQAQFADLVPPMMAEQLREMCSDSTYTLEWNETNLTLRGSQRIKGYDAKNFEYRFDPETLMPVSLEIEYNPASISEQTVSATYSWHNSSKPLAIDEKMLSDRYSDVFERFRTSNFKIENLSGTELPSFSAVTPTRERFSRQRGEQLSAPTILVFLDPEVASTARTISDVKLAVSSLPKATNTIYIFDKASADDAESLTGSPQIGETVLINASSLSRDMGVTTRPTIVTVGTDGIIRDILIGLNKDLTNVVIQKMTLIE